MNARAGAGAVSSAPSAAAESARGAFATTIEVIEMGKGMDRKKENKKKPLKTPKEKRAERAAKRASR